ncbi:MAG: glycoside hydrolase domain-containing protein, partial [Saprospiraceae bacterium]
GFYPHCPEDMNYALLTPMFDEIEIELQPKYYKGKSIQIKRKNSKEGATNFIDSIRWKGKKHDGYFINHHDLVKGGELEFRLKK